MVDITEAVDIGLSPEIYCLFCKNLLAVSPILLDTNGKNLCGRCVKQASTQLFIHNIHYERLAIQFTYPCRYASEGCDVQGKFNEIKTHEDQCPYQIIKCPVNGCTWSGITTELIIHFNSAHKELELTNGGVKELSTTNGSFNLIVNSFNFMVNWVRSETGYTVEIKSLNFIDPQADIKIVCNIASVSQALKLNDSTLIKFKNEIQNLFSINVVVPMSVGSKRLEELNKIKCPCCLLQMTPPILKCPSNHITCLDCTRADYDFCGQCVEDELHFSRQHDLELLTISSMYTCKWEGCGKNCSYKQIRIHEQSCSKRTFMCLHCFQWYGFFAEISDHDATCSSKKSVCTLITDSKVTISGIDNTIIDEYLLLAFNEIFWITCKRTEGGNINISVSNYGPVSSLDWYCYEADLQHVEDSNSLLNKTYSITNKAYNEFTVDVPLVDIANFGECKGYKITVRIILLSNDERNKIICKNFRRYS